MSALRRFWRAYSSAYTIGSLTVAAAILATDPDAQKRARDLLEQARDVLEPARRECIVLAARARLAVLR